MPSGNTFGTQALARPSRRGKTKAPVACPERIHTSRNTVERLWAKLKDRRAVATRDGKTACSFLGILRLAATPDRLKPNRPWFTL